jgi:hypothetical protein
VFPVHVRSGETSWQSLPEGSNQQRCRLCLLRSISGGSGAGPGRGQSMAALRGALARGMLVQV